MSREDKKIAEKNVPPAAIGARVCCVMKRGDGLKHFDGQIVGMHGGRLDVRFDGGVDTYTLSAGDCVVTGRGRA